MRKQSFNNWTNDAAGPFGNLVLFSNIVYGAARAGGPSGQGTLFKLNSDGTGFSNIQNSFEGTFISSIILSSNTLYGTTSSGTAADGYIFQVNTDEPLFTVLHVFQGGIDESCSCIFGEGVPNGQLVSAGGVLYGTRYVGGSMGNGGIFALKSDGNGFTNLYEFSNSATNASGFYTNWDGANPSVGLVTWGTSLYGVAAQAGVFGNGTLFRLSFVPPLAIIPSTPNLVLTWPTNYAGMNTASFTLQSTANLFSTSAWSTVSARPLVIDRQYIAIDSIAGPQKYYRLAE